MSELLRSNVLKSTYFKELYELKSIDEVAEEIVMNV